MLESINEDDYVKYLYKKHTSLEILLELEKQDGLGAYNGCDNNYVQHAHTV